MPLLVPAVIATVAWARRKLRRIRVVQRRLEEGKLGVKTWELIPRAEGDGGKVEIGIEIDGEEAERKGELYGAPVVMAGSDGVVGRWRVARGLEEAVMGFIGVFCRFLL